MKLALLQSGSIVLPPLPVWPAGRAFCSLEFVAQAIRRHSPGCTIAQPKDASFIIVPLALLREAIAWSLRLQRQLGGFTAESRDCDDFADAFDCAVSWMCSRAGITAAPVVGCISVEQRHPWAGAPAGGAHAINLVLTDAGLWIVEPQNGEACPIELYPNRASIYAANGF